MVTVILPCVEFNDNLSECLNSICNQTFKNIEILLLPSASSLDIEILARRRGDVRLNIIRSEYVKYSDLINLGIKKAKGEYIAIADSGGYMSPGMISLLYDRAVSANSDITKCSFTRVLGDVEHRVENFQNFLSNQYEDAVDPMDYPGFLFFPISHYSALYKRSFLCDNDLFFSDTQSFHISARFWTFDGYIRADSFYYIDQPLYFMRSNEGMFQRDDPFDRIIEEIKSYLISRLSEEGYIQLRNSLHRYYLNKLRYLWEESEDSLKTDVSRIIQQYLSELNVDLESVFSCITDFDLENYLRDFLYDFYSGKKFLVINEPSHDSLQELPDFSEIERTISRDVFPKELSISFFKRLLIRLFNLKSVIKSYEDLYEQIQIKARDNKILNDSIDRIKIERKKEVDQLREELEHERRGKEHNPVPTDLGWWLPRHDIPLKKTGRHVLVITPIMGKSGYKSLLDTAYDDFHELGYTVHTIVYRGYIPRRMQEEKSDYVYYVEDNTHKIDRLHRDMSDEPYLDSCKVDDWCSRDLLQTVASLQYAYDFEVCLVNYIFLSKVFTILPDKVHKILHTHDKYSNLNTRKKEKGLELSYWFSTTPEEERKALLRADTVLAVQEDEADYFNELTNDDRAVFAPFVPEQRFIDYKGWNDGPLILGFIGSDFLNNKKAFMDFYREWEKSDECRAKTVIKIAGEIGPIIKEELGDVDKVKYLGTVSDLADFFNEIHLSVNPDMFVSGLKIKSVDALSFGIPILATEVAMKSIPYVKDFAIFHDVSDIVQGLISILREPTILMNNDNDSRKKFNNYYKKFRGIFKDLLLEKINISSNQILN